MAATSVSSTTCLSAESKLPTLVSELRETKEINGVTWLRSTGKDNDVNFPGMWFPCKKELVYGHIVFLANEGAVQNLLMDSFKAYLKKEKPEIFEITRKKLYVTAFDHGRFNWFGCQKFVTRFKDMKHLIMACEDPDFEKCMPVTRDWIELDTLNDEGDRMIEVQYKDQPELKQVLGALREFVLANKAKVLGIEDSLTLF